jgi:cytochrome c biogenesis protein CcmG, thiol:disulfide interchange protein DsbE
VSAKGVASVAAVFIVIGLLAYGLLQKGGSSLAPGDPAPVRTLTRLDGTGTEQITDHRRGWVLLNFWASWCEPCRHEAPMLERFWDGTRGRNMTVLGVDLDDASDDARAFVREFHLTYPQDRVPDGDDLRDAYGMTGFPESFLVDPRGRVRMISRGPVSQRFLDTAESLLPPAKASS